MLAVLTHHLCAPFVSLYVDLALGAAFDGRVVHLQFESRTVGRKAIRPCSQGPRETQSPSLMPGAEAQLEEPRSVDIEGDKTKPKKQKLQKKKSLNTVNRPV